MIISICYVISTDSTKIDGQRILIISHNAQGSYYFLIKDIAINFADNPGNESIVRSVTSRKKLIFKNLFYKMQNKNCILSG